MKANIKNPRHCGQCGHSIGANCRRVTCGNVAQGIQVSKFRNEMHTRADYCKDDVENAVSLKWWVFLLLRIKQTRTPNADGDEFARHEICCIKHFVEGAWRNVEQ